MKRKTEPTNRRTSVENSNADTGGALAFVTFLLALGWLADSLFSTAFASSSVTVWVAKLLVYGTILVLVVLTLAYVVLEQYENVE